MPGWWSAQEPDAPPGSGRITWAYLIVQIGLFIGLAWKYEFFLLADEVHRLIPLRHDFFPEFLRSPDVVRYAYLGALASIVTGAAGMLPWIRRLFGVTLCGSLVVLLTHQASYNDMTFATSLWVSIWSLWLTTRMGRDEPYELIRRGALLARAIASMILLGGAVGKWTPEYWSGEVFYDIYFIDRDYWVFNYLRETYDTETLRTLATWYSRKVVVLETVAAFVLWMMPARLAAATGVTIFFSIAFLSNHLLYSVLASMVALCAVGFFVKKDPST